MPSCIWAPPGFPGNAGLLAWRNFPHFHNEENLWQYMWMYKVDLADPPCLTTKEWANQKPGIPHLGHCHTQLKLAHSHSTAHIHTHSWSLRVGVGSASQWVWTAGCECVCSLSEWQCPKSHILTKTSCTSLIYSSHQSDSRTIGSPSMGSTNLQENIGRVDMCHNLDT